MTHSSQVAKFYELLAAKQRAELSRRLAVTFDPRCRYLFECHWLKGKRRVSLTLSLSPLEDGWQDVFSRSLNAAMIIVSGRTEAVRIQLPKEEHRELN